MAAGLRSRRPLRRAMHRGAVIARHEQSIVHTLPAPYGGLNGRDAWEDMPPEDAIRLDNFIPGFGNVTVRPGSTEYVDLETAEPVETLATLNGTSGQFFFAASGGSLWNITNAGSPVEDGSGAYTNDRWQTANMNDEIAFVNGADTPRKHDGSAFAALTITGMNSNPVGVNVFKGRSYFWEESSQDFYYSAVNTLGGAVDSFPLGDVGGFGGELVTMVTWTRDGGDGMDDLAVFIMSSGEVIVYAGSNPGSADDWSLVGVYEIGKPLGRRCAIKVGGDAVIVTSDGISLLSRALPGGRSARDVDISDKLGRLIPDQAKLTGDSFGWQPFLYPNQKLALLNYPTGGEHQQYVVRLQTGAWGHLEGWGALCWALLDDAPYFGTSDGRVVQAFTGVTDEGMDVRAEGRQAFSYFGRPAQNKLVHMVSPVLAATAELPLRFGLAADFAPDPQAFVDATLATGGAGELWNTAAWNTFPWAGGGQVQTPWLAHSARGYAISPSIQVEQSAEPISWNGTRVAFSRAGTI